FHSLYFAQEQAGYKMETGSGYGYHTKGAPLRQVVKVHPITGRKSIYTGRHAHDIPGLSEAESHTLLQELVDFACQPPRTYKHNWQVGDLVVWDNRCLLHRARPYDFSQPRIVRATRIAGDPEFELAETAPDKRAGGYQPGASNQ
ncbi:MAG: TauD/TfdA family dioxygenase, partial [Gammaproteobacteria bacterium]|nr:TauD/TfdA family dioxygenase [Gammaproteobacteria bacterium]